MSLDLLKTALVASEAKALHRRVSLDAWKSDQEIRGAKVALFRAYADGDHRADMTPEMRRMLRVGSYTSDTTRIQGLDLQENSHRFNDNYCDIIIQTMVDRLEVTGIEADTEAGTQWGDEVRDANRFDALQGDVHEGAIRDADTAVLVEYDEVNDRPRLLHEPIWDGTNGVLFRFNADGSVGMAAKVWNESESSLGDTTRVTLYYPDRVERYASKDGDALFPLEGEGQIAPGVWSWTMPDGSPIGVQVIHVPNRISSHDDYGLSEIENVIPLQDALNRTLHSMVMTAELTGFPIRYAVGWRPPSAITPGMWAMISPDAPLSPDQKIDIGTMTQGEIMPFIQQATWLTGEIGKISRTPAPEFGMSDNASGESLKQREIGLIGKVRRFQVKGGNRWEDVMSIAHRVQTAYGRAKPPAVTRWSTKWRNPELRNDAEVMLNAVQLQKMGYEDEALRQMAKIFGWDAGDIERIKAEKAESAAATQRQQTGNLDAPPNFEQFQFDFTTGGNGNNG